MMVVRLLALLTLWTLARAQAANYTWTHGLTMEWEGIARYYSLYAPNATTAPLPTVTSAVLFLHGLGGASPGGWGVESELPPGVIAVVPFGKSTSFFGFFSLCAWNDGDEDDDGADDVGFIDSLAAHIRGAYAGVRTVFAVGFSNGGGLALRLGCESTNLDGIGVTGNRFVCSDSWVGGSCPRAPAPIPMWMGNGDRDGLAAWAQINASFDHYRQSVLACASPRLVAAASEHAGATACFEFEGCPGAVMCKYANVSHDYLPVYTRAAFEYLNASAALPLAASDGFAADYACDEEEDLWDMDEFDDDDEDEDEDEDDDDIEVDDFDLWPFYCEAGAWPVYQSALLLWTDAKTPPASSEVVWNVGKRCAEERASADASLNATRAECAAWCEDYARTGGYSESFCCSRKTDGSCKISKDGELSHKSRESWDSIRAFFMTPTSAPTGAPTTPTSAPTGAPTKAPVAPTPVSGSAALAPSAKVAARFAFFCPPLSILFWL